MALSWRPRRLNWRLTGIPAADQYLVCAGRPLEAGSLVDAGVFALNTIEVGVRMIGGKVHGSLARAGKVKGQTPKVEKQEKKKKQTGALACHLLFSMK